MKTHSILFLAMVLTGCAVGPNYQRPAIPAPATFRAATPAASPESLADLDWWQVFKDEQLQGLIRTALVQNYDLRDAVARVEAARANLGTVRSDQYPQVGASADLRFNRLSRGGQFALPPAFAPSQNRTFGTATLDLLSFEIDIWGRLRRSTEAARATLLGAEENRKAVATTLVSDVASAYFRLRELDYELEISQRTLGTRQESLQLIKTRQGGGIATMLDLRQGEQLVYSASETIPGLQQEIEQTENGIALLLGKNPSELVRGRGFTEQDLPPEVPAGLPSALLERRPDIRAAEQALAAANAQIGVAKAAYFPQISLSGFLGGQSTQLATLFNGPHSAWSFIPQVTQPIFTAGRLKSGVKFAEAEREGALIQYEKAIQTAFSEVSNALIAHRRLRESRVQQEALVTALEDRTRLAYVRYRGGVDTQLNALDADRDLFQAELTLSQIKLNEMISVVQVYKALGRRLALTWMFKYYMHDGSAAFRFELRGVLSRSDAAELEDAWRTASSVIDDRKLIVDLTHLTQIDPAGRDLLRKWHENGAILVADTPAACSLAESITGVPLPIAPPQARRLIAHFTRRAATLLMTIVLVLLNPAQASASADAGISAECPNLGAHSSARVNNILLSPFLPAFVREARLARHMHLHTARSPRGNPE